MRNNFPFKDFIVRYFSLEDVDGSLFGEMQCEISKANEYWLLIEMLFKEVDMIIPFENLRNDKERVNYIVSVQAKVVVMSR